MIATLSVLLTSPWYFQIWGLRDKVWWTTVGGPGRRPCRGRPQGRARGSQWGPGPATSSPPPATGATGAGTGTGAAPGTGECSSDENRLYSWIAMTFLYSSGAGMGTASLTATTGPPAPTTTGQITTRTCTPWGARRRQTDTPEMTSICKFRKDLNIQWKWTLDFINVMWSWLDVCMILKYCCFIHSLNVVQYYV